MRRIWLVVVALLLGGCLAPIYGNQPRWSKTPTAEETEAQDGVFKQKYDQVYQGVIDVFDDNQIAVDVRNKAEGVVRSEPFVMGQLLDTTLMAVVEANFIQNGATVRVNWKSYSLVNGVRKLMSQDLKQRREIADRWNWHLYRQLTMTPEQRAADDLAAKQADERAHPAMRKR